MIDKIEDEFSGKRVIAWYARERTSSAGLPSSKGREMIRPRISIARLMVVVGVIAVGFAALRTPSQLWASGIYSLALAAFTIAVLAIAYRRGEKRAFWVGFLFCGGVSMVLAFGPWIAEQDGYPLVTTGIL